jgi:serine phosphatase RsbU (regulator of sigma subunit)
MGRPGSADDPRVDRRLVQDRLTRLARLTSELVMADNVEAVSKTVVAHVADAVGAKAAFMTLLCDDGKKLRLVGMSGGLPGDAEKWGTFPLAARTPAGEVVRAGERLTLTGAGVIARRYPNLDVAARGSHALVVLPLSVGTRSLGAVGLSFAEEHDLDPTELEFLDILADTCAQALDRITAQSTAATQTAKLVFLADAAAELASSLDYETTLNNVAQLAVPTFADWCAIDVVVDDRLRRVAVAHVDPAKVRLAHELAERYPPGSDAPTGAWHVIRTGRSELIPEITDNVLAAAAGNDEELLQIARELHLRSALTVPLMAGGRVLGVISWVAAESERRFTVEDVALAEDLARRAAVALDNAELHSQTLAAAVQLQHAVLPATMPNPPGWDIAHYYSPSGRTEVGGDFYDVVALPDGRIVMFVGDVMGRGVTAAAAMSQMRAAVRAYAAEDPTPASVLTKLDRMYAQYPTDQLVTLVYLVADPARDKLVVANAGHPSPVLVRGDGSVEQLPYTDGCALGVAPPEPKERQQATVRFSAGDLVLLFTDGLIERRDEDVTQGEARLLHAANSLTDGDLSAALADAVEVLRDPSRDDDVAALAARRHA